ARLEVAAPPAILFPRSVIGELARDRDLDGGDGKLAVDAGKGDQGLAELLALLGIAEAEFERVLGDADGARRGLDAGALEGLHELLEPFALSPSEEICRRHPEAVEAEFVFLHAPVAEHLDLATGHAFGRKGGGIC